MAQLINNKIIGNKIPAGNLNFNDKDDQWKKVRRAGNCFSIFALKSEEAISTDDSDAIVKTFDEVIAEDDFDISMSEEEFWGNLNLSADTISFLTNMAFAVELYLKSIVCFENKKKIKGHNLGKVFTHLNDRTKKLFIRYICNRENICRVVSNEAEFYSKLAACSETFIDFRYYYENNGKVSFKANSFSFTSYMNY